MKQMSLGSSGYERKIKPMRTREFLDEMNLVVPWGELGALIAAHAPTAGAKGGRPPFAVETMLRIHFMQQWFNLSDPAMEEALYDTPTFRELARLDIEDNLPLGKKSRIGAVLDKLVWFATSTATIKKGQGAGVEGHRQASANEACSGLLPVSWTPC